MTTPQTKTQFHCRERSFEKASPPADDYVAGCIIGKTIRLKSQHCSAPPRTFSEIASCLVGCPSGFVTSTRSSIP